MRHRAVRRQPRDLGQESVKADLREIFLSTLDSLSLDKVMPHRITCREGVLAVGEERIDLSECRKVICIAIGKAGLRMAEQFAGIVKPRGVTVVVVSSVPPDRELPYFLHYTGGHPYPNAESFHAASVVLELVSDLRPEDLVVHLLSGGGSAICERPISDEISLDDCREFFRLLVTCGANIVEMNVLRKHFSAIKGGRLAERAHPARQLTLYVSDVPPDQPSTVASGPTMPDESTVDDCRDLAERLGLLKRFPASILRMFDENTIPETPKPGGEKFAHSSWHGLLGNQDGVDALHRKAASRQWVVEEDLSVDDWPYEKAVDHLVGRLENMRQTHPGKTVALLTGGELSVPVTGEGRGGRNQAFVLACARRIAGQTMAVISAGTDGIDGNSPSAGALADGETINRAQAAGMDPDDYEQRSDSFHFFEKLDDLLMTGPTGNNIRDLRALVAW